MKGIKIFATAVLGLAAFTSSVSVLAAISIPVGWYGEINLGKSAAQNKNYGTGTSASGNGLAGNLSVGYKFMPYFTLEGGWTYYANTTVQSSAGTNVATDKHYSLDLTGKGILPVADSGVELFSKIGVAFGFSKVSITNSTAAAGLGVPTGNKSSTGLYLGVGGSYSLSPAIGLVAQWTRARLGNNVGNLDLYSIGINWIFA